MHTEAPATNAELTWALAATERIDETNPEIKRLTAYLQLCWQQDSSVYTRESDTYKLPWKIIGGHEFLHIPESVHRAGPLPITSEYLANNMRAFELRAPNCKARGIVEAALVCEALYGQYETFGIKKLTHDLTRDFMDILYNLVCPMALFLPHRTSDLLDGAVAAYITIDPPGADFKNPMWSKVDWAPERIFRLMDHPEWLVTGQLQANERVEYTRTLQKCQAIFNKHYKRAFENSAHPAAPSMRASSAWTTYPDSLE